MTKNRWSNNDCCNEQAAASRNCIDSANDVTPENGVNECLQEVQEVASDSDFVFNGTKMADLYCDNNGECVKTNVWIDKSDYVCRFTGKTPLMSFTLTVHKITFADSNNTVYAFNANNTIDGELGTIIVNAESFRNLHRYFFSKSLALKTLIWNDFPNPNGEKGSYISGFLRIIENEVMSLQALPCSNKAGFIFKNGSPRYFVGSSILKLGENGSTICELPDVEFSEADLYIGKDNPVFLQQKGDLDSTINLINEISEDRVTVQTVLSAGLSAIIVGILRLMSFVFCISGKSSSGKSTLLKLAASFFDTPLNQAVNRRFSDTTARLMDVIKKSSGFLVTIDDTSSDVKKKNKRNSSAKNNISQLAYFVSGNVARGTKYSPDESFNTVIMMTSENSVMEQFDMYDNGANRRMVEIDISGCSGELTKDAEEAMRIVEHTRNNYGQLAVAFVRKIYEHGVKWLKERYDAICSSIQKEMPSAGIAQGYGETITPIVLAAEIANSLGCTFNVDEIKNSLIDDFVINLEKHTSKLTQEQFDDKLIYEAIVKIAFINNPEFAVDSQMLYISTKKIGEISNAFSCSNRKIIELLKVKGLLREPENKDNSKDRHLSYKDSNGRYYLVKLDKSFLGIDDDDKLFENNIIDKKSIDAWLSEHKSALLMPKLSPALASKWDIKVVLEKCKYLESTLYVKFIHKLTQKEYVCPYNKLYGTHNIQRQLNSEIGGAMTREEFDEVQAYVENVCNNAALMIEIVPSKREVKFINQLKGIMEMAGSITEFKRKSEDDTMFHSTYNEDMDATECEQWFYCEESMYRCVDMRFCIFYSGGKYPNCHELLYAINDDAILAKLFDSKDMVNEFVQNLIEAKLLFQAVEGKNTVKHCSFSSLYENEYALYGNKVKQLLQAEYAAKGEDIPEYTMRILDAENRVIKQSGLLPCKDNDSEL